MPDIIITKDIALDNRIDITLADINANFKNVLSQELLEFHFTDGAPVVFSGRVKILFDSVVDLNGTINIQLKSTVASIMISADNKLNKIFWWGIAISIFLIFFFGAGLFVFAWDMGFWYLESQKGKEVLRRAMEQVDWIISHPTGSTSTNQCPNCGATLRPSERFCGFCGSAVK